METAELELLDTLLHNLLADGRIMEGLSVLEQREIAGASETICSLVRRRSEADRWG